MQTLPADATHNMLRMQGGHSCDLALNRDSLAAVVHMQSMMPPVSAEPSQPPAAGLTAEQERQQFAEAMQAAAKAQAALDAEEDQLVEDARSVGIAWRDIAAMLPTRQPAELQRRHNVRMAAQVRHS